VCNIYSINPDLTDGFGHYLHYDLKIKKHLPITQSKFKIFAHNSFQTTDNQPFIQPIFKQKTYDNIPISDYQSLHSFKQDLKKVFSKIKEDKARKNIVYLYMGSVWHAWALAEVIAEFPLKNTIFKINIFHDRALLLSSVFANSDYFEEYDFILKSLKKQEQNLGLYLYADTQEAITAFDTYFGIRMPYWAMFSVSEFMTSTDDTKRNLPRFCYPGNVQAAKGFDVLSAALNKVNLDKGEFHIRTFISYLQKKSQAWINDLPQHKNVKIIADSLSTEEYSRLLTESDIILLPYREADFGGRTSGIYADAIDLEKPVIITRETWGGSYTEKYQNGLSFRDGDAKAMAIAIDTIVDNFQQYKENAKMAKVRWKEENGIQNFIEQLTSQSAVNQTDTKEQLDITTFKNILKSHRPQGLALLILKIRKSKIAFQVKRFFLKMQ